MFSKPVKTAVGAADPAATRVNGHANPGARKPPKLASLIGEDILIEGHVSGDGELQVDGEIRGDVRVPRLSVGESGRIEGSIVADQVEARGRVTGSITAKQVKLAATAHVDGDITHEQLTMETGAFFEGRSLKLQPQTAPVAAAPALKGANGTTAVTH